MDDRLPEDSSPAKSSAEVSAGHDPLEGVTSAGMIVTGADRGRIPVDFKPVIDNAVERLGSFEGAHSLYVYGSVATGTARVGYSDVDLVTVGLDAATSRRLGETLSADFPKLCRSVEVGAAQPSAYRGSDDKAYGNRVFLRHYCVGGGRAPACQFTRYPPRLEQRRIDKAVAHGSPERARRRRGRRG